MKTESTVRPQPYEIEVVESMANVLLSDNIEEVEKEEGTFYTYDLYIVHVPYSASLEEDVENNFDEWLENTKAKEQEELQSKYVDRIEMLIRGKYTLNDELAIQRQKETKPEEWSAYNEYVEHCKAEAKKEIYGDEA